MILFHSISEHITRLACIAAILICLLGVLTSWTHSVTAQDTLTLRLDPDPLTKEGQITVADPGDANRQFDPSKFKFEETDSAGIAAVTRPTVTNGPFKVIPKKSGVRTFSLEYKDGETVLKGSTRIVVPYKEVRLEVEGLQKGKTLIMVSGEQKALRVVGVDLIKGDTREIQAKLNSTNVEVVGFSEDGTKIVAQNVTRTGEAMINIEVVGATPVPVKVQINEAIEKIEVVSNGITVGDALSIPEGDTRDLTVKIIGVNGTVFKATDFPSLKITTSDPDPPTVPFFVSATRDGDVIHLAAINLPPLVTKGTERLELSIPKVGKAEATTGASTDALTTIQIIIAQKAGAIKLSTGPSGPTLTQNGRVTINAEVRDRNGSLVFPAPDVAFSLKNPTKDSLWVTLVTEGNQATIVWKNPTEAEVKSANNNQIVPRPTDVVVTAKTRLTPESPEISSEIAISVGEIRGFDALKIKLNVMDERTASDLYGRVTSNEYYVLTVRLFNDLKNPRSQQITGESILAYSSSIELAVGLEKKFDKDSDSFFPGVISKGEAERLAKFRASKALEQANSRLNTETGALASAQAAVARASNEQYQMRQAAIDRVNDALVKKAIAEKSTERARMSKTALDQRRANADIIAYNEAFIDAEGALERARTSEEKVEKLRAAAGRAAAARAALYPDIANYFPSDIAIDDGKWHPVTRVDLNRIAPLPEATPAPEMGLALLPPLTDANLRATPTVTPTPQPAPSPSPTPSSDVVNNEEAPCVGVITYRPFTFEMMVNTVDRREERSTRSRVFKVLDFIGTGTSFVTSIAVPGASSDLPLGLEKYRNLLIPGLDRLYPNYKEQQRQNIVAQAMKEIEEIPYGSDITRVIFVPKRVIHGLIRGHDIRISEICPYFFRIQVALVTKTGTVQQGTIVR